jgi:hypothetical protein
MSVDTLCEKLRHLSDSLVADRKVRGSGGGFFISRGLGVK